MNDASGASFFIGSPHNYSSVRLIVIRRL